MKKPVEKSSLPLDVSVIIPYHNRSDLTGACLCSLANFPPRVRTEYILVDDASTETFDPGQWLPEGSWKLIRNEERRSFSANNNAAAKIAQGRYLCLLNNDTEITPGWLDAMVNVADRSSNLGVLGNKHLFPASGLLHHAGMAFTDEGHPLHLHPNTDPEQPCVNYEREVPCVTFACVLVPASVYQELNGLDESYKNGFEDVDFCLRAAEKGLSIRYTPASVIVHHGQASPGRKLTDNSNFSLFASTWKGRYPCTLTRIEQEDRSFNQRRQIATSRKRRAGGIHFAVDFSQGNAFTWATVELIRSLWKQDVPLSIPKSRIHPSIAPAQRAQLRTLQTDKPFSDVHVKWSHYWPAHMRQPLQGDVNAEFFCTNYRYQKQEALPDFWLRHVRLNGFRKIPIARFNQEALIEIGVPPELCSIMPLGYAPEIDELFPAREADAARLGRRDIHLLLVTNSHDLKRYGTDLAVQALAAAFGPDAPVVVHIKDYGAHLNHALKALIAAQPRFPRIEWHNTFLDKADLIRLYARMDLQLAPFRGEGFAMKILDAMALGVPTIMPLFGGPTEFASPETCLPVSWKKVPVGDCYDRENYYLSKDAWWCEPDVEALTDILAKLPETVSSWRATGQAARQSVRGRFSWDASAERFMNAVGFWQTERRVTVSARMDPDQYPLSVVIPTLNRPDNLLMTLAAYRNQNLPASQYELIIINDHGDVPAIESALKDFPDLPIRLLHNDGPRGPGPARNYGLERARGAVALITGDDIVPGETFLEAHLEAHRRFPQLESAFLGKTLWHPELEETPFLRHVTGKGGQQFKFDDLRPWKPAPFDRFYTSNCSVKRAFICQEECMFSDIYRLYGFEDVELGYRLHLRGMCLRYQQEALGFHYHPVSIEAVVKRQANVGRMLTTLSLQRPDYVPDCHLAWIEALEFMRSQPGLIDWLREQRITDEEPEKSLQALCSAMMQADEMLAAVQSPHCAVQVVPQWKAWFSEGRMHTWEALNEMLLRLNMAAEWAEDDPLLTEAARAWMRLATTPKIITRNYYLNDIPLAISGVAGDWGRRHPLLAKCMCKMLAFPPTERMIRLLLPVARLIIKKQ